MQIEFMGETIQVNAPDKAGAVERDDRELTLLVCVGRRYRTCIDAGFQALWHRDGAAAAYRLLTADWDLRDQGQLRPQGPAFRAETRWIDHATLALVLILRKGLCFDPDKLHVTPPKPTEVLVCDAISELGSA